MNGFLGWDSAIFDAVGFCWLQSLTVHVDFDGSSERVMKDPATGKLKTLQPANDILKFKIIGK